MHSKTRLRCEHSDWLKWSRDLQQSIKLHYFSIVWLCLLVSMSCAIPQLQKELIKQTEIRKNRLRIRNTAARNVCVFGWLSVFVLSILLHVCSSVSVMWTGGSRRQLKYRAWSESQGCNPTAAGSRSCGSIFCDNNGKHP